MGPHKAALRTCPEPSCTSQIIERMKIKKEVVTFKSPSRESEVNAQ